MQTILTALRLFSARHCTTRTLVLGTPLALFAIVNVWLKLDGFFPPQDEGILLVYPDLIIRGYVPYRDFAALYPPGQFYLLAGVFRIFGESVYTERFLGAAYLCLIVTATFLIGSRVNRTTATLAATIALAYISQFASLRATTHIGAFACMLFALVLASRDCHGNAQHAKRSLLLAGAVAGTTLWFKQDLGVVALIATFVSIDPRDPIRLRPFLAGVAIPACALIVFAAIVGWDEVFDSLVLDPIRSAPGRFLPLRPNWTLGAIAACVTVQCVIAIRAGGRGIQYQLIWLARGMAMLSLGYAVSLLHRVGERIASHGFMIVSLTLVSLSILLLHMDISPRRRMAAIVASFVAGLLPLGAAYRATAGTADRATDANVKLTQDWISLGERRAPVLVFGDSKISDLQNLLDEINRRSHPGQGLFVGPSDLRFANYNDTFIYYLLPHLRPVSRYLEMNPGCANRPDSGLTKELSLADWLILTTRYDTWSEPNASTVPGPAEPNDFVRRNFCLLSQHGHWKLLYRCGSGSDGSAQVAN